MLAINEEFESFQGEGSLAGTRMYFVRLQGCSVGCYFCDTKYTWKQSDQTVDELDIIDRVLQSGCRWMCITGGEPLEQDLHKLVELAHRRNIHVQIETSGMYHNNILSSIDWVTVSPKMLFSKKQFNDDVLGDASELKCVVTKDIDVDYYLERFEMFANMSVPKKIFQPVDNDPKIVDMLLKRKDIQNWKVMIQQQKVMHVR